MQTPPAGGRGIELLRHVLFESDARVVFITGAGISVKSGVPLYRSSPKSESSESSDSSPRPRQLPTSAPPLREEPYVAISDDDSGDGRHANHRRRSSEPVAVEIIEPLEILEPALPSQEAREKEKEKVRERHRQMAIWDSKLEALARKSSFLVDPRSWYRYFWFDTHHVDQFLQAIPNEVHCAIGLLCEKMGHRFYCATQNVDRLHIKGGCPKERLIQVHGEIGAYRCSDEDCPNGSTNTLYASDLLFMTPEEELAIDKFKSADYEVIQDMFRTEARREPLQSALHADFPLPCCPLCRRVVLPMTLLFDENYQTHEFFQFSTVCEWLAKADVLIFIGTSFAVWFPEYAIRIALMERKLVFNINIVKDEEYFFLFDDALSSRSRRTKLTTEVSSPRVQELSPKEASIRFNWDSGTDDAEAPDTRASVSAPAEEIDVRNLKRGTVCQIIMPADQALMAAFPEPYLKEVDQRLEAAKLKALQRRWQAVD